MNQFEARCLLFVRCYGPIDQDALCRKLKAGVSRIIVYQALEGLLSDALIIVQPGRLLDVTEKGRRRFSQVVRKRGLYGPRPQMIAALKSRQVNWADL